MAVSLGLRIKTGFAVAVIVERVPERFAAVRREVVALSTADIPDSQQPYHPALDLPEKQGAAVTKRAVDAVRATARKEMAALLKTLPPLRSAGLVVGSVISPGSIANPHIRAHAMEGQLFREVVVDSLTRHGISHSVLLEREAYEKTAADLSCSVQVLRREIDLLGKGSITPWRAEEKLAALAAYWLLRQH